MEFFKYLTEEQQASVLAKLDRKRQRARQRAALSERIISFKENETTVHKISTAYIYVITNPAFTDWYKIGTCVDLEKRVQVYQTSDPLKGYSILESWLTRNRSEVEKLILATSIVTGLDVRGEWVYTTDYKSLRKQIVKHVQAGNKNKLTKIDLAVKVS
jgi:hypothetical protein